MSDTIKVLLVKPLKPPQVVEIPDTLESMQKAVGGDMEAVYPFEDPVAIVCNDEGKIRGLPLNRALRDSDGEILDIIAGDFFICDASGENFGSLSEKNIERYMNVFRNPERFFNTPEGIKASPVIITPPRRNNDAR